jgi:4-hydroxy-tetrahydrodipicolinate reductase
VGEHTVIFAGQDEILEISHHAHSREIFAIGAIKAARFLINQNPGLYGMDDLVNNI